jgi:hypothetical protein
VEDTHFIAGPWRWKRSGMYITVHGEPLEDSGFVCDMEGLREEDMETVEANARLIATAPEMYEALEFISHLSAESYSPWADGLRMARAAIAKVRP